MEIKNLSLDLETKSSVDIGKAGAYKYAESPDFEILLFGVSVNHGPMKIKRIYQGKALNLCLGETARNIFIYGLCVSVGLLLI